MKVKDKLCAECGITFAANSNNTKFCSKDCKVSFLFKNYTCKIHERKEIIVVNSDTTKNPYGMCNICRKERRKKSIEEYKKKKCKNCHEKYIPVSGFERYCCEQCNIEFLKNNYRCETHGNFNDGNILIRYKKNYGIQVRCKICYSKRLRVLRKKKKDNGIKCKECGIMFCRFSYDPGYLKYCTPECARIFQNRINSENERKRREELHDSYVKSTLTHYTKLSLKEIPEELTEIKKLQLKLKRKIKEIKENEKC